VLVCVVITRNSAHYARFISRLLLMPCFDFDDDYFAAARHAFVYY